MKNFALLAALCVGFCLSATVCIAQKPAATMKVKVYFAKDDPNADIQLVAVERDVKKTKSVADAALRELLKGVGEKEKSMGLISTYEPKDIVTGRDECQTDKMKGLGAYLIGVTIRKGVAIVNFKPEAECYLQTAITAGEYVTKPIEATLKQFKSIKKVEYAINGKVITDWDA
jgi:spore germination protein GerM